MKTALFLIIVLASFFSCTSKQTGSTEDSTHVQTTRVDSVPCKIDRQWNEFITKNIDKGSSEKDVDINVEDSVTKMAFENCFDTFLTVMKNRCGLDTGLTVNPRRSRVTRHTYFGSANLKSWFDNYDVFSRSDEVEITLGIYTPQFLHAVHATDSLDRVGRLGLFLVASKSNGDYATTTAGTRIPAYDLGGLYP